MSSGVNSWRLTGALCLMLSCAGTAWLWGAEPRAAEGSGARVSFQERRERLRHQMDVELEAMARICSLNSAQRERLEVAARGVVERVLEDREKAPEPDAPVEWRWEEAGLAAARADLLEHPLWGATVREVLNSAQMSALEREQSIVKRNQREAAIRLASGLLQAALRLTQEQVTQLAGLLEKTMPEGFCEPELDASAYTHWLDPLEVQRILTKKQFAYWLDLQRSSPGEADPAPRR